jgi:hypothetical protein
MKSVLLSIVLYGGATAMLMTAIAGFSIAQSDDAWWQSLGRWTLTGISLLVGFVGGGALGALSSVSKAIRTVEEDVKRSLQQQSSRTDDGMQPSLSLEEERTRYARLLDQALLGTIGRLPLPAFLDRGIRRKIQEAVIDAFFADVAQRGLTSIGPHEFRMWLVARGVSLGLEPVYGKLTFWQYAITSVLGLLLIGLLTSLYRALS